MSDDVKRGRCWLFHHWGPWSKPVRVRYWSGWEQVYFIQEEQRRECVRCGIAQDREMAP